MEIIHHHFETLCSTNAYAKEHLAEFDKQAMTVISAETQSAGVGQQGREWLSPAKLNIYASFCFFAEQADPLVLTHLAMRMVRDLLKEKGVVCTIKAPNDLYIGEKKLAGVLCETHGEGVILGIGLNVNMPKELLAKIDKPATSLLEETGRTWDCSELLDELSRKFQLIHVG